MGSIRENMLLLIKAEIPVLIYNPPEQERAGVRSINQIGRETGQNRRDPWRSSGENGQI